MISRHSKIVCTIGPVTRTPRMIRKLIDAGMDVARLNFSHGTHEEHAENVAALREAAMLMKKPIAILADLQGPKIRTGELAGLHGLSPGRVSKLRGEFHDDWRRFCGEESPPAGTASAGS